MIPRYLKFAIIAGVAVVLSTSAMARVHFHGGTIHDPRNEIKEKILNTKLDKISEQIKTAKNNLETWTKPLDNIKAYGDDIKRVISDLNAFKKDTQGILHSEQQSIKELYNLKINDESTIGDLKREQQRLDRLHENEIIHTLERANNASEANEVLNQQAQDILKQYNVKATFFVIGKTDDLSKEMYKKIVEEGHTLGMHSYSHKYSVIYDSMSAFEQDFNQIHDYLKEVTGVDCKYYRFPGGSSNQVSNSDMREFIRYLNDRGITYYDWNVSSGDATSQAYTADELIQNVMGDVTKYKTSVVLMHDSAVKPATVEALPTLIEQLQGIGAEILPIDENTATVHHVSIDGEQGQ